MKEKINWVVRPTNFDNLRLAAPLVAAIQGCAPFLTDGEAIALTQLYFEGCEEPLYAIVETTADAREGEPHDAGILALIPTDEIFAKLSPAWIKTPPEEVEKDQSIRDWIGYAANGITTAIQEYKTKRAKAGFQRIIQGLLASGADVHFMDEDGNEIPFEKAGDPNGFKEVDSLPPIPRPKSDYIS